MNEEQAEVGNLLNDLEWERISENRHVVDAIMYLLRVRKQELAAQEKAPDLSDRG